MPAGASATISGGACRPGRAGSGRGRTRWRVLKIKFMLGLFENLFVDPEHAVSIVHSKEHRELALESAREGIVLLKNGNKLLPIDKNVKSIAVIGPNAASRINLLGDYIPKKML